MPTDYDKIREGNIREYGTGTTHLSYFADIYSTRTHFLYEVLQNAEDALALRPSSNCPASYVHFHLHDDRLEIQHNGVPFTEHDVKGICGIGAGTKADDFTQIGKFGIGFKSVYAYTFYPRIHSGDEHFEICRFVEPHAVDCLSEADTLIVLPFDQPAKRPEWAFRPYVPVETSVQEIGEAIQKLGIRTMLFLRHIEEIKWTLPDGESGHFIRNVETIPGHDDARKVKVRDQGGNIEEWQIFQQRCEVQDADKPHYVTVEVAYLLKDGAVTRAVNTELVVYFPTEKKTELGFLLQAPFKTTKSRDNIKSDDPANRQMIEVLAELTASSLGKLRDLGLLNVASYNALPLRAQDFPEGNLFRPIYDKVHEALQTLPLLPAHDGVFVCASDAKLASADWLRKLLRAEHLKLLYQKELKWVHGDITDKGRHQLWKYFREELKVDELTPDGFARRIDLAFLSNQSDQWIIDFYTQLPNQKALWKKGSDRYWDADGPLRKKPFIRLQDGSHVRPFGDDDKPSAYLPAKTPVDSQLSTVKAEIACHDEVRRFLVSDLKIPEFDIVAEVIEHVLPKYTSPNPPQTAEHLRDIEKIVEAFQADSQEKQKRLKDALKETPFILLRSFVCGDEIYQRPDVLYFQDDSLETYFSDNSDVGFIGLIYKDKEAALKMFASLGVRDEVRIDKRKPDCQGCTRLRYSYGWHERGLFGFDPDIEVEGLSIALSSPTPEKSLFIWNKIVLPNAECIRGTVEKSSRKTYENSSKEERISEFFGRLLIESKWLPGPDGHFLCPAEISLDELPEHYERSEKLADLLGMKKDVVAKLVEEAGVKPEILEYARNNPQEIEKLIAREVARKERPTFPTRPVANPERRQERLGEQLTDAVDKEYEKRERSVRTTNGAIDPTTWLRNQYTNEADQMVCQICKEEMPFRKRDGTHYFEKKEVLSKKYLPKEHEAQYLALCPLCAAKYDEFVKTDDDVMAELREEIVSAENCEIPISLDDEKTSIRFVETHIHDLKNILEEMG